jgi:hypothetical protein
VDSQTPSDLPSYPNPDKANQLSSKEFTDSFALTKVSMKVLGRVIEPLLQLIFLPIGLLIVALVASFGVSAIGNNSSNAAAGFIVFLLSLVGIVVAFLVAPGLGLLLLKGAKGEHPTFKDVFKPGLAYFWRYIGLSILIGLLTIIGLILLVVPGLFVMKWYLLAPYYLLDRNVGVLEAMRLSREAAGNYSGPIWGVVGVEVLINLIGAIPLIGWIVSPIWAVLYLAAPAARYAEVRTATAAKGDLPPTKAKTSDSTLVV